MDINQIIVYVLIIFAIIGAVDYMAGNKLGVGVKFEEGLHTMGALTISMIPLGVLTGGLAAGFPIIMVLKNVAPVTIMSVLIAIGMWKFQNIMIKLFMWFGKGILALSKPLMEAGKRMGINEFSAAGYNKEMILPMMTGNLIPLR